MNKIAIRDRRRELILNMFTQFGEISETRTHWKKKYLFVVVKNPESAQKVGCFPKVFGGNVTN